MSIHGIWVLLVNIAFNSFSFFFFFCSGIQITSREIGGCTLL